MTATTDEIEKLRALLKWSELHRNDHKTPHFDALRQGLKTALNLIDEPNRRTNIAMLLLAAIIQNIAVRATGEPLLQKDGSIAVQDADMFSWAVAQANELLYPPQPKKGRKANA